MGEIIHYIERIRQTKSGEYLIVQAASLFMRKEKKREQKI